MGPADLETVDCVLCGESASSLVVEGCPDLLHGTPGVYSVVRCLHCDLLRTDPRPTEATIDRHYPPEYLPFNLGPGRRGGFLLKARRQLEKLYERRYGPVDLVVPPPEDGPRRLLDVGGGSGTYAALMAGTGWDPWVLEPSPVAARAAVDAVGGERVTRASIGAAEYPPGFFDLVTMNHVLEHLHDPVAALTRARTWMRPGGRVRVVVPNVESLERRLFGSSWLGFDLPRHLFHFSPGTLGRLLEHCGYAVESNVPQWMPSMFGQSAAIFVNRVRGRTGYPRLPYYAASSVGAVMASAGLSGAMTVTAYPVT